MWLCDSITKLAEVYFPLDQCKPRHPWTSSASLQIVQVRRQVREISRGDSAIMDSWRLYFAFWHWASAATTPPRPGLSDWLRIFHQRPAWALQLLRHLSQQEISPEASSRGFPGWGTCQISGRGCCQVAETLFLGNCGHPCFLGGHLSLGSKVEKSKKVIIIINSIIINSIIIKIIINIIIIINKPPHVKELPFPCVTLFASMALVVDTSVDNAPATGAARRRREQRLRAYLRYARMSVAMALAESNHHSAPRGQSMARAGEEGHEEKHNAPWRQKPNPPQRPRADAGTRTGDDAECTAQCVIPQEHTSQRIVEQSVDTPFPQAMARTVESYSVEPGPAAARRRRTCK